MREEHCYKSNPEMSLSGMTGVVARSWGDVIVGTIQSTWPPRLCLLMADEVHVVTDVAIAMIAFLSMRILEMTAIMEPVSPSSQIGGNEMVSSSAA
jgi:hypothetical protein